MLELRHVTKRYDDKVIFEDLSLKINTGEIVSILGPSGCGKTTLLHMILGLTDISGGRIAYNGEDITRVSMRQRGFNIVFQDYALFPNLNVKQNIEYGLRNNPSVSTQQEVDELIDLLDIKAHLNKRIHQLSGGQKQRVAVARAIVNNPKFILADEPTGALDTKTSTQIMDLFYELNKQGSTIIMITHDREIGEAAARQIVIRDGNIVQDWRG